VSAHRLRWLSFLAAGFVLVAALGWVTWAALRLEKNQFGDRLESLELELQNRALGRIDAMITTILARENQRPPMYYLGFFEPERAYNLAGAAVDPHDYYQSSPLLRSESDFIRLYFSVLPDGSFSSPQLPQDDFRKLALDQGLIDRESMVAAEHDLAFVAERTTHADLLASIDRLAPAWRAAKEKVYDDTTEPLDILALLLDPAERTKHANTELRFRNYLAQVAIGSRITPFVPRLIEGAEPGAVELLFIRDVPMPDVGDVADGPAARPRAVQGFLIDWTKLHRALLLVIADIYPEASLVSTRGASTPRLVTIPFALESPPLGSWSLPPVTPTRLALLGLWIALGGAAVAVALTLQKTLELSERRRSFVSAVTHELRTPLTTFCMYSEMLADGIVKDPAAQQEYFVTLKDESIRLRRIVENVLSYARLEGRTASAKYAPIGVDDLLAGALPVLERRASEAGMELRLDLRPRPGCRVEVEVQAVQQILFNLVDNAAKYGTGGEAAIHLRAVTTRDELEVHVLDHGPGIPDEVRRAVFTPFKRAAGDAEGVIPGIGLGLSLARGMARNLGGDVRVREEAGFGAVFVLTLPLR